MEIPEEILRLVHRYLSGTATDDEKSALAEWLEAIKGGEPGNCNFDWAQYITEFTHLGRGRRHRQDAVPPQRKDRRGGERRDIHRSIRERPEAQGDLARSRFRGRRARHRSRHLPPLSDGRGLLSGIFRIHEYLRRRVGHDAG